MERDGESNSSAYHELHGRTLGVRESVDLIQASRKTERLFPDHK